MTAEDEAFLQQILEERDRLFRETSRLKSQLTGYENFESEKNLLHPTAQSKGRGHPKAATTGRDASAQDLGQIQRTIYP